MRWSRKTPPDPECEHDWRADPNDLMGYCHCRKCMGETEFIYVFNELLDRVKHLEERDEKV